MAYYVHYFYILKIEPYMHSQNDVRLSLVTMMTLLLAIVPSFQNKQILCYYLAYSCMQLENVVNPYDEPLRLLA